MSNANDLVAKYLRDSNIMQLATSDGDQMWACNIHFYADEQLNLYWISTTDRLHSVHIQHNSNVAAAVLVQENTTDDPAVIGISIAGKASLIGNSVNPEIGESFVRKHHHDVSLLKDIESGENAHRFYTLKPTKIVLFDTKNFPQDPRQIVRLV